MFYQSEINYSSWYTIIIVIVARSLNIVILSVIIMIILSSISTSFNMTNTATTVNSNIDISPSAPPPSPSVSSQQSSFLSSPCPTAHFEWTPFPWLWCRWWWRCWSLMVTMAILLMRTTKMVLMTMTILSAVIVNTMKLYSKDNDDIVGSICKHNEAYSPPLKFAVTGTLLTRGPIWPGKYFSNIAKQLLIFANIGFFGFAGIWNIN